MEIGKREGWMQEKDLIHTHDEQGETVIMEALSPRELEVWRLIAAGMENDEIASSLRISHHTVKAHIRTLMGKLGARNRAHAVKIGYGIRVEDSSPAQIELPENDYGESTVYEELTPRQLDVIRLVAKGFDNMRISRELGIDERTVRSHVSDILTRWNATNRTQAANIARHHGLVLEEDLLPPPDSSLEAMRWAQHYLDIAIQMSKEER